jgi:hypothetical protein
MIVEEVQVYLLVDLHFDCYVNNNLKFQKLHLIVTWDCIGIFVIVNPTTIHGHDNASQCVVRECHTSSKRQHISGWRVPYIK